GALKNKGLEIAWTNDPVGLFYVHIQGSGVLQLPNGEKKSLKFDGSNEKPFRSIAKYMQNQGLLRGNPSRDVIQKWLEQHPSSMRSVFNTNPRYIYFTLDDGKVKTASGVPVISGHTVAVDTKYIPFGAVILAKVPIINSWGKIVGNEWRILFSQDRGNAIKGPARIDIYTGVGEQARKMANNLTGHGKMYLLLNKSSFENSLAANDYLFQ
ncbi:MAG: murein transglycosylase A, partial [Sulfurovum sp.]